MERVEDAAFGPLDRIGQLTMRNLDIDGLPRASSTSTAPAAPSARGGMLELDPNRYTAPED